MGGLDLLTWVFCIVGCVFLTACAVVAAIYLIFRSATRGDD